MTNDDILILTNEVCEILYNDEFIVTGGGNDPTLIIKHKEICFKTIANFETVGTVSLSFFLEDERVYDNKSDSYEECEGNISKNIADTIINWIDIVNKDLNAPS